MKLSNFGELVPMLEQCVYHSELKGGLIISGLYLQVPIRGNGTTLINLERRVHAEVDQGNEENYASRYFLPQLEYLLTSAEVFEAPVYQDDEPGTSIQIGNNCTVLDRSRLGFPQVRTDSITGDYYLDCVNELATEGTQCKNL